MHLFFILSLTASVFINFIVSSEDDCDRYNKGVDLWIKDYKSKPDFDPSNCENFGIKHLSRLGKTKLVKELLANKNIEPGAEDNYALYHASKNGHTEIVKALLADPRVEPRNIGDGPLQWAVFNGHHEIVRHLMKHPQVDAAEMDYAILQWAHENISLLKQILQELEVPEENLPSFRAALYDLLEDAVVTGNKELTEVLLNDPRSDPNGLIKLATTYDFTDVLLLILDDPRLNLSEEEFVEVRKYFKNTEHYGKLKKHDWYKELKAKTEGILPKIGRLVRGEQNRQYDEE